MARPRPGEKELLSERKGPPSPFFHPSAPVKPSVGRDESLRRLNGNRPDCRRESAKESAG